MSEESVKRAIVLWFVPLLVCAAPSPLIVGAVRDQFGEPVSGAVVEAGSASTRTQADGTFAVRSAAGEVRVSCGYCDSAASRVGPDGIVAVIVRRYEAPRTAALSSIDVETLPYARPESLASLTPFAVLYDWRSPLIGARVGLNGLHGDGGLVVQDAIPVYDVVTGSSPFGNVPGFATAAVNVRGPADAVRYGDLAAAGTFFVNTSADGTRAYAIGGSETAAGASAASSGALLEAGVSGDAYEGNRLARASQSWNFRGGRILFDAFGDSRDGASQATAYGTGFSAARVHYDGGSVWQTAADVSMDRGQYATFAPGSNLDVVWSDATIAAGVRRPGPAELFADAYVRHSTGVNGADVYGFTPVTGSIRQVHGDVGVRLHSNDADAQVAAGMWNVNYGHLGGANGSLSTAIFDPNVSADVRFSPHWSASFTAAQAFQLPVLAEVALIPAPADGALPFDRIGVQTLALRYTDVHRITAGASLTNATYAGINSGPVTSAGMYAGWQIAPKLSLRAWTMHFDSEAAAQPGLAAPYALSPLQGTPASVWLSYRNELGMYADLIERHDFLDTSIGTHLDASLSGPVHSRLRWYVQTEQRGGDRYYAAGLRIVP